MQKLIDGFFQQIINYCLKNNLNLIYKLLFAIFKKIIKGPFVINFIDYKFLAYPQKKSLSRWMLKYLKPWDLSQIKLIYKIIADDKILLVDCGSNYGAYAIPVAKKFINSEVLCFDASKKVLSHLKKNVELNNLNNIKYYNLGISNKKKFDFFNDNILHYKNSGEYRFKKSHLSYKVKTILLDNFLNNINFKIYKKIIFKLDIEGYEFNALLGMEKILNKRNIIVFLELSKMLLKNPIFSYNFFRKFLLKKNLIMLDLNLNVVNLKRTLTKIYSLNKKNTIGDYLLVNKSYYKKEIKSLNKNENF
jgi:FkbM family methyltransferase